MSPLSYISFNRVSLAVLLNPYKDEITPMIPKITSKIANTIIIYFLKLESRTGIEPVSQILRPQWEVSLRGATPLSD
jgi:hypothetical protein